MDFKKLVRDFCKENVPWLFESQADNAIIIG